MPIFGNITKKQGLLAGALLALLLAAPHLGSLYMTGVLTVCLIYAIWAVGWDFFSGLSGRENFGYPLFIGVGAYVSGYLDAGHQISPWLGLWAGMIASALLALLLGFPTLRLRGPYFAFAMLAASIVAHRLLLIFWEFSGGEEGIQGLTPLISDPLHYYYLVLAVLLLGTAALVLLARSRHGLLLRAIRADEGACLAAGIHVTFYKIAALVVSCAFAALGGALYASYQMQVSPQIVSFLTLISVITMVYVGGFGSVYGAGVAAIGLSLLGELLRSAGEWRLLIYALVLILVISFLPAGLIAPLWRRLGRRAA